MEIFEASRGFVRAVLRVGAVAEEEGGRDLVMGGLGGGMRLWLFMGWRG